MSTSRLFVLIVLVLIVFGAAYGAYWLVQQQQRTASTAGQLFTTDDAPILTNEAGEQYEFAVANGSLQVVTLWATWVPDITTHLATISDVVRSYDDLVEAIAVNRDEQAARVEAFFSQQTKPSNLTFVQNPGDALYEQLDAYAMPETVVFDGAGEIVWRQRGLVDETLLRDALQEELDK